MNKYHIVITILISYFLGNGVAYSQKLNPEEEYQKNYKINNMRASAEKFIFSKVNQTGNSLEANQGYQMEVLGGTEGDSEKEEYYRRNSIYTLLLYDSLKPNYHDINGFGWVKNSEKYNSVNLGSYLINTASSSLSKEELIANYLKKKDVAKRLVADWFDRDYNGNFSTKKVADRGMYDASELDKIIASKNIRGDNLLKDAGEDLIGKTFVIVLDIDRKMVALGAYPGSWNQMKLGITAYLYQLKWDSEVSSTFYSDYWVDKNSSIPDKVKAFDASTIFDIVYKGKVDFKETVTKGFLQGVFIDQNITDVIQNRLFNYLESQVQEFCSIFPLWSTQPLGVKVGKKEGIKAGDKFEIVEKIQNGEGNINYKRMGILKVSDADKIWDNTIFADWFGNLQPNGFTKLDVVKASKQYNQGMLIRQLYK